MLSCVTVWEKDKHGEVQGVYVSRLNENIFAKIMFKEKYIKKNTCNSRPYFRKKFKSVSYVKFVFRISMHFPVDAKRLGVVDPFITYEVNF